uniref:FecR family protein n=1 Tax=Pedobacter schmidteae TaxID=2201271 RepID=UPI000EAE3B9B|nr:FecR family protein [Pedobacter schmidteae]
MQEEEIKTILDNYRKGQATEAEKALLESWYLTYQEAGTSELGLEERTADLDGVLLNLQKEQKSPVKFHSWPTIAAAVAVLMTLSAGLFFYLSHDTKVMEEAAGMAQATIIPGGNKATLTLANGKIIDLTAAHTGNVGVQSGIHITKTADGQLIYRVAETSAVEDPQRIAYNTIATPKGGQYQILLPDGSRVWLNAASSLRYPAQINSSRERRVELNGEAYFEIAKADRKPFIVATAEQEVMVLGTHFNVKSYADDGSTKTTLLEGSVQVKAKVNGISVVILKPGQQSELKQDGIKVVAVEAEDEIDWKNGDFVFKEENLESMMRKIARWYDVQIVYQENVPKNITLEGLVSRSKSIGEVLAIIESTGKVHFKIEGRKINVLK